MITYTDVEDHINSLYHSLAIEAPQQLDIDIIANKLRLQIHYGESSFRFDNSIVIKQSTQQEEWQSFGHEFAHFLRHVGNPLSMHLLFTDLQEHQANHFAYHFCVPTFMLENIKGVDVYVIMQLFNVEFDFALKRLELYKSRVLMKGVL